MKIYFAGPDVFFPDYRQQLASIKSLCAASGLTPLCPGDVDLADPMEIFNFNISLIQKADGVVANLNPFRGAVEPDSGTVFECGYAYGLGKFVIGYVSDQRGMADLLKSSGVAVYRENTTDYCPDGSFIENFGSPLNLMLARSVSALTGNVEEAVALAAARMGR